MTESDWGMTWEGFWRPARGRPGGRVGGTNFFVPFRGVVVVAAVAAAAITFAVVSGFFLFFSRFSPQSPGFVCPIFWYWSCHHCYQTAVAFFFGSPIILFLPPLPSVRSQYRHAHARDVRTFCERYQG